MAWTTQFSDAFTDTQFTELHTHNASWVQDYAASVGQRIDTTGTLCASVGDSRYHTVVSLASKQSSEIKIVSTAIAGNLHGVVVNYTHVSTNFNDCTGYLALFIDASTIQVRRFDNGSNTVLSWATGTGAATLDATGKILRLERTDATTLTAYWNGVSVGTITDNTYTTGSAGLIGQATIDGWGNDYVAQDDAGGGSSPVYGRRRTLLGVG